MEYYGYAGKILHVDLTSGQIEEEALDLGMARRFIGGWGINNKLMWDLLKPGVDPLSPDNPIVIGVGPLTGTILPGGSKVAVTYKRPVFAHPTKDKHNVSVAMGGCKRFGAMLKSAGYDHVIITGRAPKPSYLYIGSDGVKICDASELWGKSIRDTSNELVRRHTKGSSGCGVWAIGQAGEKLVRWALALVDDRGTAGRSGGGAISGSKNLKAVVTWGDKGIKVAEPKKYMELAERKRQEIINHPAFGLDYPPHGGGPITKEYPKEIYLETRVCENPCMGCLGPEFDIHHIKGGRFDGHIFSCSPLFPTVRALGQSFGISDYRDAMELINIINGLGMDYATLSRMLPLLCWLYERGVITAKDTEGLELKLGDFDRAVSMIDMIVNRRGELGKIAAEGWYPLGRKVGWDYLADLQHGCSIIKGVDVQIEAMMTAFFNFGFTPSTFSQIVFSKPQHTHAGTHYQKAPPFYPELDPKDDEPFLQTFEGIKWDFANRMVTTWADFQKVFTDDNLNIGRYAKHAEDCKGVYNAMVVCDISPYGIKDPMRDIPFLAEAYSAATGLQISPLELRKRGEALWNLDRMINAREGFSREDDIIPELWIKNTETPYIRPGENNPENYLVDWFRRRLKKEDLTKSLDEYYDERKWDIGTGLPTKGKLQELELGEFTLDKLIP